MKSKVLNLIAKNSILVGMFACSAAFAAVNEFGVPEFLAKPGVTQEVVKPAKVVQPQRSTSPYMIPTDGNLIIVGSLKSRPDVVNDLITITTIDGYRCDTLSFAMVWGNEFTLKCNNFRYIYTLKDVGGQIVVTPN